jgi:tetratricopeptide (TPR) repeat protein
MIAVGLLALAMLTALPDGFPSSAGGAAPDPVERDLVRADSAYVAGRDDEARAAYRLVLSHDPRSVRANHRLALLLSRIDQSDSALLLVQRARMLEPSDAGLLITEARLLSWAGRLDESIADYDALLALDPSHREGRLGRSRVLGWAGRYAAADSMYAAMLAADPNDVDALTGRAQNAAWRGRLDLAEAGYVAATRIDADNVDALIGLARLRHGQGRQRSAADQVSRALALEPGSRTAQTLRREIRAAQRPQVDLAFSVNQDSDRNIGWSRTFSTSIALADGLRGSFAGGSLAASDPIRDAQRTLGEVGLDASYGRAQAIIAVGTRWLDASTGPARSSASYRTSLSYRVRDRLSAGVGVARFPMDETALLIGSGLRQTELQASVDGETGHGVAVSAGGGTARLSDGNHRASGVLAVMHPWGRHGSVGVLGRVLSFEERGVGYFSPDRFTLAEARGTLSLKRHAWSGRLNGGLGVQQVGGQAAGQLAWRAAGQLRFGWAVIDHAEASLGASNSAASSTTGAFRYLTAGVSLRLGL